MSKPEKFTNLVQQILKNNKLDFKPSEYTYFWELISEYGENNTLYIYEIIRQASFDTWFNRLLDSEMNFLHILDNPKWRKQTII